MPNIASVLKDEITRLARKEIKSQLAITKKSSAQYRRDIAALKREVASLQRHVARLQSAAKKTTSGAAAAPTTARRFSPGWVSTHRAKIEFSRADYADLVGVSSLTIYNWETGRSRPRDQQLESLAEVRSLGKREAIRRLEDGE